jgi:hypothetical protein
MLALALLALGLHAPAWASDAGVRIAFVSNFARYTDWPAQKFANPTAPVVVCLLPGDREMSNDLSVFDKHTISGRPVRGISISKATELEGCNVLYIPADFKPPIKAFTDAAERARVLTVSDRVDFVDEGGMIGLVPSGGRYEFDVSLVASRAAELRLSAQLLKLARTVK